MPAFLVPMLIGAFAGAATNPDDRLRGALLGGTLGAVTGGLGGAVAPAASGTGSALTSAGTAASKVAAQEAAKAAITKTAAQEVAKTAITKTAATTAGSEVAKQASIEAAKKAAMQKTQQEAARLAAEQTAKQTSAEVVKASNKQLLNAADLGVNANPATAGFKPSIQAPRPTGLGNIADITANTPVTNPSLKSQLANAFKSNNLGVSQNPGVVTNSQIPQSQISQSLQSAPANGGASGYFGKAGQAVRSKPMQAMQFASALSPKQQQQQQPVVVAQPYQQQQMAPPPSVEEKIAKAGGDGPTFIPRGLFDEARNEFDEEERYNSRARSKALFS